MAFEEKSAWIMGFSAIGSYLAYLIVVLGRADHDIPLAEVSYVATLLWSIGIAVVATIVGHIVIAIANPKEADRRDERDKQIHRFSEYVGQSFVVIGGIAALILAMLELRHFWIANAVYLAFVLSGLLSSITKIVAYRKGFQ